MDIFIKILKFIGFLAWLAVMVVLFSVFSWGGLIIGLAVSGGAASIFGDD